MASSSSSSLAFLVVSSFALCFLLSSTQSQPLKPPPPHAIHLPIRKNATTQQYYTTITIGSSSSFFHVVLDLGGQFLWFNCEKYTSLSYRPIPCRSSKCKTAKGSGCVGCFGPKKPGCTNNTCGATAYNPYSNSLVAEGFGEDTMSVSETDGQFVLLDFDVPRFPFSCVVPSQLEGLASETSGMIGLGRTNIALHKQVASTFKLKHKFAICVPSSSEDGLGDIFIGGGPYVMRPALKDFSKSLITTPLIINPVSTAAIYTVGDPSDEYFIGVKGIKVNGNHLSLNNTLLAIDKEGVGGTKISTVNPYTVLHTSIYKALIDEYLKAAASKKIKRVTTVAPFRACFSANSIKNTKTGPDVPVIDLVLEGNKANWVIHGANSMVLAKKGVWCLGFVDGGSDPRTSIVLGGHQLENNVLEFDLDSNKLGFSNSLLLRNTSCSHYRIF